MRRCKNQQSFACENILKCLLVSRVSSVEMPWLLMQIAQNVAKPLKKEVNSVAHRVQDDASQEPHTRATQIPNEFIYTYIICYFATRQDARSLSYCLFTLALVLLQLSTARRDGVAGRVNFTLLTAELLPHKSEIYCGWTERTVWCCVIAGQPEQPEPGNWVDSGSARQYERYSIPHFFFANNKTINLRD